MTILISTLDQSLDPGERVSLYKLDATSVGGTIQYFCESAVNGESVSFGGVTYTPIDMQFDGLETTSAGALPTPHITVSNKYGYFQVLLNTLGDLLGCPFQRIRTYKRFLDGKSDADPTAYHGPDTFLIERKVKENSEVIEWELSASIDQEGKMLPGRQVVRNTCMWHYRYWNATTSSFDYSKATCPYTAPVYFDELGNSCVAALDKCGRRVSDCKIRFGSSAPLPFGGFPGVGRVRG